MTNEEIRKKFEGLLKQENVTDVNSLGRTSKAYRYLCALKIYENGEKLSLEEKFARIGYPRKAKRAKTAVERIGDAVSAFIARTGKDVNALRRNDPEYMIIKNAHIRDAGGRLLTVKEKIKLAGFDYQSKYSTDVRVDLIREIDAYLASGGSFHVKRHDLPFYEKLRTYYRSLKDENLTFDDVMKELGYPSYSSVYHRYKDLEKIYSFRDQEGYCDSYRKDSKMKGYVGSAAQSLGVPVSVVVLLICNENLKRMAVDTEWFSYLKKGLLAYNEKNGTLKGIKRGDPKLYERMQTACKYISLVYNEKISKADLLSILELDSLENDFAKTATPLKDVRATLQELRALSDKKSKITRADIGKEYRQIVLHAANLRCSTGEYLKMYGINYVTSNNQRLKKTYRTSFPYLDEMRARRDELVQASGITEENGYSHEEVFENNLDICLNVYREYEPKVITFEESELSEAVSGDPDFE